MTSSTSAHRALDPQPELILFDLDDTLASTSDARKARLRRVFARALLHLSPDMRPDPELLVTESLTIDGNSSDHYRDLLAKYGVHHPGASREAQEWMISNRYHGLALLPDAIPTLEAIRKADPERRIGMITNGPEDIQEPKIELLGIRPYFDFILVSGTFGAHKPDPSIFAEALNLGKAKPHQAVYIGDSQENDIAGALASGISPIWMNYVGRDWLGSEPRPAIEITELRQLHPLLRLDMGVQMPN
jgi:HAD superfamily hydrolase (TIGR01549 family)